jgi:hypothetical protein
MRLKRRKCHAPKAAAKVPMLTFWVYIYLVVVLYRGPGIGTNTSLQKVELYLCPVHLL